MRQIALFLFIIGYAGAWISYGFINIPSGGLILLLALAVVFTPPYYGCEHDDDSEDFEARIASLEAAMGVSAPAVEAPKESREQRAKRWSARDWRHWKKS